MSLNRNAKPLKSNDRLEREYYRRDERRMDMFLDSDQLLPRKPKGELWTLNANLLAGSALPHDVCMYCWTVLYCGQRDTPWVHASTGSARCFRKTTQTATPIPGVLLIEELELS